MLLGEWMTLRHAMIFGWFAFAGCVTPSALGEISLGPVHPVGDALASDGMELRLAAGIGDPGRDTGSGVHLEPNGGRGVHLTYRSAGITQELALGLHLYGVQALGKHAAMFVRLGANLLEWDRVGTDDGAGLAGPSFELGFGSNMIPNLCVVASAARDLRFNDRDDTFVGVSLGLCAIVPSRRL